jgi:hypothetical protein
MKVTMFQYLKLKKLTPPTIYINFFLFFESSSGKPISIIIQIPFFQNFASNEQKCEKTEKQNLYENWSKKKLSVKSTISKKELQIFVDIAFFKLYLKN